MNARARVVHDVLFSYKNGAESVGNGDNSGTSESLSSSGLPVTVCVPRHVKPYTIAELGVLGDMNAKMKDHTVQR